MHARIRTWGPLLAAFCAMFVGACDTGFGQPCTLPKTEEFRLACSQAGVDPNAPDAGINDVQSESKASCAVRDYAGCETRVCLVYRGSSPFCSEPCLEDGDCESKLCRPLLGDPALQGADICKNTECYCVRKGDEAS